MLIPIQILHIVVLLLGGSPVFAEFYSFVSPFCYGSAVYNVTFFNMLTTARFGSSIPSTLAYSPLTVTAHSNRFSILVLRGYASKEVQTIAQTGNNGPLLGMLKTLKSSGHGVKNFAASSSLTVPGSSVSVAIEADCNHPFITALAMIGPSPDWFVQISNVNIHSRRSRKYKNKIAGSLIAYDAGTDDGTDLTSIDSSIDIPTIPQKNIAPLREDITDRFMGRNVGKYIIKRIK